MIKPKVDNAQNIKSRDGAHLSRKAEPVALAEMAFLDDGREECR